MRPIFKCKEDKIEAHYYKTIAEGLWLVQCFACGARGVYNAETQKLVPYNKNKGHKNEFNIYLERMITDDGKDAPVNRRSP